MPILNSTLIAFIKPYYGRYAGTEGNLKTEVVDTILIEIPDPRNVTVRILRRLQSALSSMQEREVTHMLEETFRACHTADEVREAAKLPLGLPLELQQEDRRELDDAVFEMLGVADATRRRELIDHLYREVTLHHRSIRIVEVQKMEQRRHGGSAKISVTNLALNAWNELEPDWQVPLAEWIGEQVNVGKLVQIPEGEVRLPEATNFFEATTVYFGKMPAVNIVCDSRAEAELISAIARAGLHVELAIPTSESACMKLAHQLENRLNEGFARLEELAQQYAGTDKVRDQVAAILKHWFIVGRTE